MSLLMSGAAGCAHTQLCAASGAGLEVAMPDTCQVSFGARLANATGKALCLCGNPCTMSVDATSCLGLVVNSYRGSGQGWIRAD
jgi:hypothetical protein